MNKRQTKSAAQPRHLHWFWVMLLQMLLTLAFCLLMDLSLWMGGFVYILCRWVLTPVFGLVSACMATRAGFLNYLAFLVPPLMSTASNLILWGYLPPIAPVLLCGFVSLVGAAAGEVLKRQHER